jgi:hypothetical protein
MKELNSTLEELRDRYPSLSADDLFVLWFLRAYLTDQEAIAEQSLGGGTGDKGIDAVLCDMGAKCICIVQAKYRQEMGQCDEKRDDVLGLVEKARHLTDPDDQAFNAFLTKMEVRTAGLLREARKKIQKDGFRISLYFATLGNVSKTIRDDAEAMVRKVKGDVTLDVLDSRKMTLLLQDYFDGVAPPIPSLDLEMEQGPDVKVNGVAQRYDERNNIECWVFSMNGAAVAHLVERGGIRLFARNIRGFLGNTAINRGMTDTLSNEANRFFYYNNGITMLCDEAVQQARKGRTYLRVSNPQIINGQQTTRTLAAHSDLASQASVLVKVLVVPRLEGNKSNGFEKLVSKIVGGTNWQNAIRPSDLMANDRVQIDLERSLRKLNYAYVRKRQTKGEARNSAGGKHFRFVTKSEFAQVVAACDVDPVLPRTVKEGLFSDEYYERVFPNTEPDFYLSRYWAMRAVRAVVKPKRGSREFQWLALHQLWSIVEPLMTNNKSSRAFWNACELRNDELVKPLQRCVALILKAINEFYKERCEEDGEIIDPSTFFKSKRASAAEFTEFLNRSEVVGGIRTQAQRMGKVLANL